jgi:hypothetical protein
MDKADQEAMNDALLSDEQFRQALRNFANPGHDSLQDEGEDSLEKTSSHNE